MEEETLVKKEKSSSKDQSTLKEEKKKKKKKTKESKTIELSEDGNLQSKKSNNLSKIEEKIKRKKSKDPNPTKTTEPSKDTPPESKKSGKRKRELTNDDSNKRKSKKLKVNPEELEIDITAPAPPSKRARRLQKKGKPNPPLPSTSQPPSSSTTDVDGIHPDRKRLVKEIPRAEFSVWIGNLSYKSDVKALRGWLVRGDKRVTDKDITRINLPLNADGQSKGFAYVDLLTEEAMEKIISRSEESVDGRNLLIKNAKSFAGRPAEKKQRYQTKATASKPTGIHGGGTARIDRSVEKPEATRSKGQKGATKV